MTEPDPRPETLAAQGLGHVDPVHRSLVGPVHLSTTFERDPDGGYSSGRAYGRADNPAFDDAELLLARLEGGASAMLFATGMAACSAVFCSLIPGDHVVVARVVYWGLRKWLSEFAASWGIDITYADTSDLGDLERALRPGRTRLVWVETPANPTWAITDLAAAAMLAHAAHALLVVDSTVATPVHTRPIEHGADLVVHSASKSLNGHSDVLAGAVVAARDDPFTERIRAWRRDSGSIMGGFEAWLLHRGMRTLYVRVAQASSSAMILATELCKHPKVTEVLYPGLADHPGHAVADRQMERGFGAMLSIRVAGGEAAAMETAARLRIFKRATSLGGVESLVEHRSSIEGPSTPVPPDLLRLSVGLEHHDDLLADLFHALDHEVSGPPTPAPVVDDGGPLPGWVRSTVIARGGDLSVADTSTAARVDLTVSGSPGAVVPIADQIRRAVRDRAGDVDVQFVPDSTGLATPGPLRADAVAAVLTEQVTPAIAAHGGTVEVASVVDGTVTLVLGGGCQGCTLAEVTLRQGIEPVLRGRFADLGAVVDATDHGAGAAPFYPPKKR